MTPEICDLLWEILDYMENRQDAWTEDGQWVTNDEMQFAVRIREVLGVRDSMEKRR